jgi:SAM-dependent MidA family methyltransferase
LQTELVQFIRHTIRARGPQPFPWFMEQALYHPEHGYYSSGRAAIGRRGDYFTNVSVGPLFGKLMAAQFAEIWERMGKIDNFILVEQGAHDGQFAHDVLAAAQTNSPEFFSALRYRIIEPYPVWQDRQTQTLELFREKVEWAQHPTTRPHLNPLPGGEEDAKRQVRVGDETFSGIQFSNELLDAMPAGTKFVGLEGDDFVLVEPPPNSTSKSAALEWIDHVSRNLIRGYALIVDYGFARDEFREVIQARAQHRHLDSPFEEIGDADITMHVNWSEMAERAEANGLRIAGFTDQHHFLTGIISTWPELLAEEKSKRGLQTLLHPEMLGRAFQVLALGKDVDLAQPLAGFKFARDPRIALGL